jgi:hypothetical protein
MRTVMPGPGRCQDPVDDPWFTIGAGVEGHVVENGYAGLRTWIEKARRAAAIDGAEVKLVGRLHGAVIEFAVASA